MNINSLKIGNLTCSSNLVLAPMSGVTNSSFRRLLRELNGDALGLVVTEFISIEGLTRGNKRTQKMLEFCKTEHPISIQIFGHDVDRMAEAAQMVEDAGADIIDINCGCPVPKVVRRGGGCELMRQGSHLEKILKTVIKSVSIPVTLKIRSGWDEKSINAKEIALMAENSGISALAIHGRTRQQLYRGNADWNVINEISEILSIPVIGSGDVVDAISAEEALKRGVSGLMIGRGAISNPFIFSDIASFLKDGKSIRHDISEYINVLLKYYDMVLDEMGSKGAIGKMKQLIGQVTKGVRGGAEKRQKLCRMNKLEEIKEGLFDWLKEIESESKEPSYTQPSLPRDLADKRETANL